MKRISSIDITRGIVMVIMALDHVRDYLHVSAITESPTNLETTTPILFFTRWITHLCAPTFVFLAGTSSYLSLKKENNISKSRTFLLKRGLYLILLDLILVNFILFFDPGYHTIIFEVIAAIGFGFIILGLLANAPIWLPGAIGLLILCCHNLLPLIPFSENTSGKTIVSLLFSQTAVPVSPGRFFVMAYPPIPWLGIILVGFASGKLFERTTDQRRNLFIKIGLAAITLFLALRFINIYGDRFPWTTQESGVYSFLSFMNVTKYPPSLQFALVTLGIMFLMLAFSEHNRNKFTEIVSVYGRVPLFYFLLHLLLIHLLMIALMFIQGFEWSQMDFASGSFGRPGGLQSGISLGLVYLVWIAVVAILYKPCIWYGKFKSTHQHWWLKYL